MNGMQAREIFLRERKRFAKSFPIVGDAIFEIAVRKCTFKSSCKDRDLAYALPHRGRVVLLHRALQRPRRNVVALIRHELAHLAAPSLDEQGADALVEFLTGERVFYDDTGVQTLGRGQYPRPARLPR